MNDNDHATNPDLGSLCTLVVDDQSESRILMRAMLGFIGITNIHEAGDGRGALRLLEERGIDLVICDWNMPECDGLELLHAWHAARPETPFIMVTGRADIASIVEARQAGVTAYVRKPFSPDQLEARIRDATGAIIAAR